MEYAETIIVGGGPAGSSCAWNLNRHGKEVLILDKQVFPRLKLCGGWITSKLMESLEFTPEDYPYSILKLKTKIYLGFLPFALSELPTRWTNYSIRRIEFDSWLLERSGATIKTHQVKTIEQEQDYYVIDGKFKCKYLVGAGGTSCPVRRIFFPDQRQKKQEIVVLEKELNYPQRDEFTHLFFFQHGLKGYSWYVPKGNGYVNIGLGGYRFYFEQSGLNIHTHFQWFLETLVKFSLLDQQIAQELKPSGYGYYLFSNQGEIKKNNCFLIGDSAGLATIDLGEGIRPAVESGLFVAEEILGTNPYRKTSLSHVSLNRFFEWIIEPFLFKVLGIT